MKLWLGARDIGLELAFERITMEELGTLLADDFARSKKRSDAELRKAMDSMDDWQREDIEESLSRPPSVPRWIDNVSSDIREQVREGYQTGDLTAAWVKKWSGDNCVQSDGKIPFLNFKNLSFFFVGKRLRVRDGLAFEGLQIGYCALFDNALGSINLRLPAQEQ